MGKDPKKEEEKGEEEEKTIFLLRAGELGNRERESWICFSIDPLND